MCCTLIDKHYIDTGKVHVVSLEVQECFKHSFILSQKLKGFPELVLILSTMCLTSDVAEDPMSFNAAVCLGRLCCPDDNAKYRLKKVIDCSQNSHMKAEVGDVRTCT